MTDRFSKPRATLAPPAPCGGAGRSMMLEMVLIQMQARGESAERAREIGQLAFMQWLGALPGGCDYAAAARAALTRIATSPAPGPALATFRALLAASLDAPARPLDLRLPSPCRRGGTRARR
ncbi:hypothetical protein, partial [Rhodovulum marinum]